MTPTSDKVVVITGATSGLGLETAKAAAREGWRIGFVARSRDRGEAARDVVFKISANDRLDLWLCDLSSPAQIRRLSGEIRDAYPRLDVLVNNAAVVPAVRTMTADGFETQFVVNHLAYFLLTNLLLDPLRAAAPSRVVNVSSGLHARAALDFENLQGENSYKPMTQYGAMKLANILFTYELACRLEGSGVTAVALSPGFTATGLGRNFSPGMRWAMKVLGKRADRGAAGIIRLAVSPEVEGLTGRYFRGLQEVRSSRASLDRESARRLWDLSARLTGLTD
jgi:NAD(P)-dependent dehydrogenase (short-subunit alcohol dehydrogenase family)